MLSVVYVECRYAECRYAECRPVECRYAESRYAESRDALVMNLMTVSKFNNAMRVNRASHLCIIKRQLRYWKFLASNSNSKRPNINFSRMSLNILWLKQISFNTQNFPCHFYFWLWLKFLWIIKHLRYQTQGNNLFSYKTVLYENNFFACVWYRKCLMVRRNFLHSSRLLNFNHFSKLSIHIFPSPTVFFLLVPAFESSIWTLKLN
jgi:hypothetical protein